MWKEAEGESAKTVDHVLTLVSVLGQSRCSQSCCTRTNRLAEQVTDCWTRSSFSFPSTPASEKGGKGYFLQYHMTHKIKSIC